MNADSVRLKYICRLGYGDALPKDEESAGDIPVFGSNGQYTTTARRNTEAPAIIVGRKGSYGKVNWTPIACLASDTTFFIDQRLTNANLRWLYWILQTLRLDEGSQEAAVPGLNRDTVYEQRVRFPSSDVQRRIADYLDRETARIDALVAEKERMLALLEEKRAALISRAVTRGLDPNVPMKPSGLDWLGDIPAHWETRPIKYCVASKKDAVKTGPFGSQLVASEMDEGTIKVYNQQNVIKKDLYSGDNYITEDKFEELKAFSVYSGDILITTRGTIGRCAIVPDDAEVGILHPCLMRIQVNPEVILPEYLALLIQDGHIVLLQLRVMSNATTIEVIYSESLNSVIVPVPPIYEQKNILVEMTDRNNAINKAIVEVRNSIILLKERRAALITAAVTGQIPLEEMAP